MIRIVLSDLPAMLSPIVRSLIGVDAGLEVAAEVPPAKVPATVDDVGASCVIVGMRRPHLRSEFLSVLRHHEHVTVLGVTTTGEQTWVYELRPQRSPLGELSTPLLLEVLRPHATGGTDDDLR